MVGRRKFSGHLLIFTLIAGLLRPDYCIQSFGSWKHGTRRTDAHRKEQEAKRFYRQERKRRLRFPGHYCRLLYRVLWKDMRYRRKDISYLFLSAFLSALFLFLGLGIYQNFSGSYGEDGGMLGLGLVEIVRDFLVAILFIGLFPSSLLPCRFIRSEGWRAWG